MVIYGFYWGYRDNRKENGNYYSISGSYKAYTGIVEKKMEATIVHRGYIRVILG